jgi:periplasmic protein TonB
MQIPRHDIMGSASHGMSRRRMAIVGSVAMLHVLIVYALVSGMAQKIIPAITHTMIVDVRPENTETKNVPPPPKPQLAQPTPTQDTLPPPVINVATETPPPITMQPTPPQPPATTAAPDTGATGLAYTHTTPPYPHEAAAAQHQGTVTLQLVISAQGDVTQATVVQSSGFPELDAAAVAWVQQHWRYKPALQNGMAVPSQAQAAVKFDLKTAHG